MRKGDLNVHVFETDATQNLIDDFFFQLWLSEDPSIGRILSEKKYGSTGLLSEKTEDLNAELNERAEAATISYSTEVDFLQYIYSVLVTNSY